MPINADTQRQRDDVDHPVRLLDAGGCHGYQLTHAHAGPPHRPDDAVVAFAGGGSCGQNNLNSHSLTMD